MAVAGNKEKLTIRKYFHDLIRFQYAQATYYQRANGHCVAFVADFNT
jgi:hypothetical protein